MSERKSFPLRLDESTYEALRQWADDELRSVNAQVEFIIRRALQDAGRARSKPEAAAMASDPRPRRRA